jgi:hypothetical protein
MYIQGAIFDQKLENVAAMTYKLAFG